MNADMHVLPIYAKYDLISRGGQRLYHCDTSAGMSTNFSTGPMTLFLPPRSVHSGFETSIVVNIVSASRLKCTLVSTTVRDSVSYGILRRSEVAFIILHTTDR